MPDLQIDVEVSPRLACALPTPWLRKVMVRTLLSQSVSGAVELGLLIAGDTTVRRLNRQYRGIDRTTDVLAFGLAEIGPDFPAPDGVRTLGQVVVSYPRAVAQARDCGHTLEREVAFLIVHGVLHLLGYDHQAPEAEAAMLREQETVLLGLGLTRNARTRAAEPTGRKQT